MTSLLPHNPLARSAQTAVVLGVTIVVFIAYTVPFFGLVASLCIPFVTHTSRRHLWPEASNVYSIAWSLLAWAGLWLPGVFGLFTSGSSAAGDPVSTTWLIIPLCAPTGLSAVVVPALAASVTCLAGLIGAAVTGRGWSWVVAAWLAPWVHYLVFSQLPHEFLC
jgi:hypothetical protein